MRLARVAAAVSILGAVSVSAPEAQAQGQQDAQLVYAKDVADAAYTYCKLVGPNQDPYGSPFPGVGRIETVGSSTTVTAETASDNPFVSVAAGDMIVINIAGVQTQRRVATKVSDDEITVDTAINTTGSTWGWYQNLCGTGVEDGWLNMVSAGAATTTVTVTTLNATSIDYQVQCRIQSGTSGTALAAAAINSATSISYNVAGSWNECRLGLKVTADVGVQSVSAAWSRQTWTATLQGISGNGTSVSLSVPLLLPNGTATAPSLAFAAKPNYGLYLYDTDTVAWSATAGGYSYCRDPNCTTFTTIVGGDFKLASDRSVGWSGTTQASGTRDTFLYRDAANTLALRNLTNPQTFNIYNTYTDGSNYEKGFVRWTSNVIQIGMESLGSGLARAMQFLPNGTIRWTMASALFYPASSDTNDIGTSSSIIRELYLTRSIQGSKTKTIADASATAFVRIALPQTLGANFTSGTVLWQLHCDNGSVTTYADRAGQTVFTCNNISGTEACVFDATAQQVTQAATYSFAAPTFTATGGTDTVDLNVNADCGGVVGPTNMYIHYRLDILDPQTVTPQ